jgi:hypothetical protein
VKKSTHCDGTVTLGRLLSKLAKYLAQHLMAIGLGLKVDELLECESPRSREVCFSRGPNFVYW